MCKIRFLKVTENGVDFRPLTIFQSETWTWMCQKHVRWATKLWQYKTHQVIAILMCGLPVYFLTSSMAYDLQNIHSFIHWSCNVEKHFCFCFVFLSTLQWRHISFKSSQNYQQRNWICCCSCLFLFLSTAWSGKQDRKHFAHHWSFVKGINPLCGNRLHVMKPSFYGYLMFNGIPLWHLLWVLLNKIGNWKFCEITNLIDITIALWGEERPWKGKCLFLVEATY